MTAPPGYVTGFSFAYPKGRDYPVASLAQHILNTIVATYDARAEFATALPERRLVTIGSVAVDGPVLAVMYGGIQVGPPGNELARPWRNTEPQSATFNIELWRTYPNLNALGMPPTAAQESSASDIIMQDTWLLLEAAYASDQLGIGVIANVGVMEPQGETVGCSMTLQMQVP